MDVYAFPGATFAGIFHDFYSEFARPYNKHMALGETSVAAGSVADKEGWAKQLADTDLSAYPCFISVTWFEYNGDGGDFRVVMGQDQDTIAETLANFV